MKQQEYKEKKTYVKNVYPEKQVRDCIHKLEQNAIGNNQNQKDLLDITKYNWKK